MFIEWSHNQHRKYSLTHLEHFLEDHVALRARDPVIINAMNWIERMPWFICLYVCLFLQMKVPSNLPYQINC